ncbi:MAG: hypothetical protein ACI33M_09825 [Lysinibacillus sp.]
MENVKKAVQGLKEFQAYWINATDEERRIISSSIKDESSECIMIIGLLNNLTQRPEEFKKENKEKEDEYFPYE